MINVDNDNNDRANTKKCSVQNTLLMQSSRTEEESLFFAVRSYINVM